MLGQDAQECVPKIRFHNFTKRRVVPDDVSGPVSSFTVTWGIVLKGLVIPDQYFLLLCLNDRGLQVIILSKNNCIKNFLISPVIGILISSFSIEKRR